MKKKLNVFPIVTILLSIALVFNLIICIGAFYKEGQEYRPSGDSMIYAISNQRYESVLNQCYQLNDKELEDDPIAQEFYYVSKYFENASMYKTYEGYDEDKAEHYKAQMAQYQPKIETYTYTIDEINGYFGIE